MPKSRAAKTGAFCFLFLLGIVWCVPLVFALLSSFKTDAGFITSFSNLKGPWDYLTRLWPKAWTTENYIELFTGQGHINTYSGITTMFKNSFIVAIAQTAGVLIVTTLSAYAYERLPFKGGNAIFWSLMYMSMFPNVVSVLPLFRIANALGWVNNLHALIWPGLAGVFNIFLIRNFLKGVPKDLDEAATIDGAGSFKVFLHVIVPSIAPVLIVVGLFAFNGAWNDFLWPSIVMTDVRNQTLTAGLRLLQGQYDGYWAHMIASCIVSMVPPLLLYLVAQKYFLQGISVQAAVKG